MVNPDRRSVPFPDTRWSLVADAGASGDRGARALQELCTNYWFPLYAHARRMGNGPEDAEDLTQAFFAHLLRRDVVPKADQRAGKLRSYLLVALKNFARQEWRRANAQRRGGGVSFVQFDAAEAEQRIAEDEGSGSRPDDEFDRRWAESLLRAVVGKLRQAYQRRGALARFDALAPFLTGSPPDDGYASVASALGIEVGTARLAVFRMRKRYRELLREEIAATVSSPDEVDGEIEALFTALSRR